jgi:2-oxoisovalerate dehydrogenase E2 component (dihydrolipoyl transacylase)
MSLQVFKLPDLGEGTVAAEIVAWRVGVGDSVKEDQPMVEVSTDKAVVEVPAPVTGRVVTLHGQPGDTVAVGADLISFDTDRAGNGGAGPTTQSTAPAPKATEAPAAAKAASTQAASSLPAAKSTAPAAAVSGPEKEADGSSSRVMASPATRRRAHEAGIDLSQVRGSGPGGRIERSDLDSALKGGGAESHSARQQRDGVEEIKVLGVRRVIAQRMSEAKRNIPHFSYVEEVDVTELESLRHYLNRRHGASSLSFLPFVLAALVRVLEEFPQCNALYDASREVVVRHKAVHAGIATQTRDGLKVPVVRHAEAMSLDQLAAEIRRVSGAARDNTAKKDELSGSTITVTSLGKLGGIASTPVINSPEVAIIGINRAVERPMVVNGAIAVRLMMNLSSSFDHRFVDGFDAAAMIQALKERLEHPATLFI